MINKKKYNNNMNGILMKIGVFVLLFIIICVMAGIYGFLYAQISYTVSFEYFTQLEFKQFYIPESLYNRIGAGIVGVKATWWMGLVIGIVIIPIGLIIPKWKNYFFVMLKTYIYVLLTALLTGIISLIYGKINFKFGNLPYFGFYDSLTDPVNFYIVRNMHTFSYIGGLVGIVIGIIYIIIQNIKIRKMIKNMHNGT